MDFKEPSARYQTLLARKLIEALEKRNIEGFYCESGEETLKKILELVPKDALVSCGGSATLREIGVMAALKNEGYQILNPDDAQGVISKDKLAHKALSADFYLMSTNAISLDGELVNIAGYGKRTAALIFGPRNVIVIVGMNKVEPDLDAAIRRAKMVAAPKTLLLFKKNYKSFDELVQEAQDACGQLVITGKSLTKGRIKVILVGESLGY